MQIQESDFPRKWTNSSPKKGPCPKEVFFFQHWISVNMLFFEGVISNEWDAKTAGCTYTKSNGTSITVFFFGWYMSSSPPKNDPNCLFNDSTCCKPWFLESQFVECSAHVVQRGLHRFFFLPVFHYHCLLCQKDGHDVSLRYCFTWVVFYMIIWYVFFVCHVWFSISH